MVDQDGPELPPHLRARRERAQQHEAEFIGLTVEEAVRRAGELELPLKVIRPHAVISLELAVARITVHVGADGRVVRTSVS